MVLLSSVSQMFLFRMGILARITKPIVTMACANIMMLSVKSSLAQVRYFIYIDCFAFIYIFFILVFVKNENWTLLLKLKFCFLSPISSPSFLLHRQSRSWIWCIQVHLVIFAFTFSLPCPVYINIICIYTCTVLYFSFNKLM